VERLDFEPGQFLSFTEELNGKKITRAYSIASPPDGNRVELCLNRVQDGLFSPYLFELAPGDEVEFKGPYGAFVWRQPITDSVLVAAGTGIAPIRSMLLSLHRKPEPPPVGLLLLFGVRHEHGLLYREEFESLAGSNPNFRFWPTLSRPHEGWQGRSGWVQTHLAEALGDRRDLNVYVCGLREMVDSVRAMLKEMGVDRKRIIFEKYD
jgi:CDP-4-dehydro-6-deoxyglucose reductase